MIRLIFLLSVGKGSVKHEELHKTTHDSKCLTKRIKMIPKPDLRYHQCREVGKNDSKTSNHRA